MLVHILLIALISIKNSVRFSSIPAVIMDAALDDLRTAEDEVYEILKVAEETLKELQNLPQCSSERLIELSAQYMTLIKSVYGRISVHSSTMTKGGDGVGDIYTKKKEDEIFESLEALSELQGGIEKEIA